MKFNVCYVQLTLAAPQSVKAPSWVWSSHIQKVCGSLKGWKYSVDFEGVEVILKPDWRIWKTGMVLIASWRNFATIEHTADAFLVAFWPFRGRKNFQHNKNFKHKITFFTKSLISKNFANFGLGILVKYILIKRKKVYPMRMYRRGGENLCDTDQYNKLCLSRAVRASLTKAK